MMSEVVTTWICRLCHPSIVDVKDAYGRHEWGMSLVDAEAHVKETGHDDWIRLSSSL